MKSLWRWLTLILLVISIGFNFYLFKQLEITTLQLNHRNLNPVFLSRYPTQAQDDNVVLEPNKIRVIFFGDSRSEQWISPTLSGFQFINRGISGETSGQSYLRFRDHISYLKPDVMVMQLGVNDLRMKPLPSKNYQEVIETCQQNIVKVVQEAEKLNAQVILTTIFPLAEGSIPWKWRLSWPTLKELETGIQSVNQFIRTSDKLKNVTLLDAAQLLKENDKVKPEYARDMLHLNRKGYELLNQELTQKLSQLKG